jgi:positive phototaxis protein PixI
MNVSDILQLSAPEKKKLGTPHLKVWLDREMPAAIAMNHAHAAMAIEPSRISPMPNMPSHVVGMLALNLTPVNLRQPKLNVILLEVERQMLACLVPRVDSVMRFMPEEVISPLGNFSAELVPYLEGWLPYSRDILLVLSARALVTAPLIGQKI